MTTLAETLAALKSDELERLWVECEGYRATGVLAGDAELRRMVDAFYFGAAPAAHLLDGVHQVTYEMAKRSIPLDAVLEWHHIVGVLIERGGAIGGMLADLPHILADRDHLRFLVEDRAKRLARESKGS